MKILSAAVLSLVLCSSAISALAQGPSEEDRQRFRAEVRNYKHEFLTRELDLTREQQRDFFPLYDEMDDEIDRINTETRDLERKVDAKTEATDTEVEAAARAVFLQKSAEGQVEEQYFDRFKQILQGRQLLKLRKAEREFTRQLMRQHRRARTPERHNAR